MTIRRGEKQVAQKTSRSFLHGLCTADVQALAQQTDGGIVDAAIVDASGNTLDLLTLVSAGGDEQELLALSDADRGEALRTFFDKYIFPADAVEVEVSLADTQHLEQSLQALIDCERNYKGLRIDAWHGSPASTPDPECKRVAPYMGPMVMFAEYGCLEGLKGFAERYPESFRRQFTEDTSGGQGRQKTN